MQFYGIFTLIFVNCNFITAIQRRDLLPYGPTKGDVLLKEGDDEISVVLKLKKSLQFYNTEFNILYVGTNGILSTEPPPSESEYLIRGFPLSFPVIAPFLTDIDTSEGRGAVYFRSEESLDTLIRVTHMVQKGFPQMRFRATHCVIATWDQVSFYEVESYESQTHITVNTFQTVLAGNKTDTFALFLYPEGALRASGIRDNTSDSSEAGPTTARVGFNRGDTSTTEGLFYSLVSKDESIKKLFQAGNSGFKGVWIFHIGSSRFDFQRVVPAVVPKATPAASPQGLESGFNSAVKPQATGTDDNSSVLIGQRSVAHPDTHNETQGSSPLKSLSQSPPVQSAGSLINATETCGSIHLHCSQDSFCTEHPTGPCCQCRSGFYGNGRQCFPGGVSQRLSGKLHGLISIGGTKVQLKWADLHGYAVVGEGRVYVSIGPVPDRAGWALMTVGPLISLFGWLFALELKNHQNGFSITGAEFTHHAEMTFYPNKEHLNVTHVARGLDSFNHIRLDTHIQGYLPSIPQGARVQIQPYKETYQYNNSVVTSSSLRDYTVVSENGGAETFSFLLRQNVTLRGCQHGPWNIPDFQQLDVEHTLVTYSPEGHILRYAIINTVGPVGGELPGLLEVNPCTSGKHYCDPMALCLPGEGVQYHCQCAMGFRGDGRNCYDVDECTEGLSACGPHSQCVNLPGSHHCHCDTGYEFDFDWRVCADIDECLLQLCHPFASCSNTPGSFHCQCWPGYEGDGFLCQPHQEPGPALTVCQQHRDSLLKSTGLLDGHPLGDIYIPQCSEEGLYKPLQCLGTTGHCWCVDSRGQERVGTRTLPGNPPANCDQPAPLLPRAETLCERWRSSLLSHYGGQPSAQDYMPQCDSQGHFSPVQCYGNSSFCWCADKRGREVTGTRSHDAVKPPCISDIPPYLPQSLVNPTVISVPSGSAVLYAGGPWIGVVPLDGARLDHDRFFVLTAQQDSLVTGLGFDCRENMLYWTDLTRRSISRVRLVPGHEPELIIDAELSCPEGVAVDTEHRKLYWVDSGTDRIETSHLDGRGRAVLFDSDLVNPRALVVHSETQTLFWTDWNRDGPKIECSTTDGRNRKILVQEGLNLPNALTFDTKTKQLCWADAGTKRLECVAPDGTGRLVINSQLEYPFSLDIYNSHVFYTDWKRDGISVLDKSTGKQTDFLPIQMSHLYGIAVIPSDCL
ncbi:nidogen-2 [Chanos chanos]|uniref:Nidogen-2 n=1 Tax=Chanos chanos TaxID=29144 RepID=A0A6J2V323_CHACN|nr:nidogen-2-like [Chanos chanos]